MSDIEIRDDRAAGRLEACAGDEVVGHIEYFVLEAPGSRPRPGAHRSWSPRTRARASRAPSPASCTPSPPARAVAGRPALPVRRQVGRTPPRRGPGGRPRAAECGEGMAGGPPGPVLIGPARPAAHLARPHPRLRRAARRGPPGPGTAALRVRGAAGPGPGGRAGGGGRRGARDAGPGRRRRARSPCSAPARPSARSPRPPAAGVPVLRVDRPMAAAAVAAGPRVVVLATVESTLGPTVALVEEEAAPRGLPGRRTHPAGRPAPGTHFEAGDMDGVRPGRRGRRRQRHRRRRDRPRPGLDGPGPAPDHDRRPGAVQPAPGPGRGSGGGAAGR